MTTLVIDTSNQEMALALTDKGKIIGDYFTACQKNHSVTLMPAIDFLFKTTNKKASEITKIVVSEGPGSYTGLRIGVTTAKTLAWTLGAELHAVSSLAVIAASLTKYEGLIVPIVNARRNNVYTGAYRWSETELISVLPDKHANFKEWLMELKELDQPLRFIGSDMTLFKEQMEAVFGTDSYVKDEEINRIKPISLIRLATDTTKVTDIDSFIPTYLKRVEAEEKWLETHVLEETNYVERI